MRHYLLFLFFSIIALLFWTHVHSQTLKKSDNYIITNEEEDTWAVNWIDFDNDGYEDLYISSYDSSQQNLLYRNTGFGFEIYEDETLMLNKGTVCSSWADCNEDGLLDLILSNYKAIGNDVLINNCNGSFHRRTEESLENSVRASHGVTWVDVDSDGDLDTYICSYDLASENELLLNNGDCTFDSPTSESVLTTLGKSIGAVWADINNDRFPDLFVPKTDQDNVLYINLDGSAFTELTLGGNLGTVGAAFGDVDNDGDLDLVVANASDQNNHLYRNVNSTFFLDTLSPVSNDAGDSHGISIADLDNDGWSDIIITNDRGGGNFLYWNDASGKFIRDTLNGFIDDRSDSFGIANADFDNDGDLDIYIANHSYEKNYFYQNETTGSNWVKLLLKGTVSNTSAIGARIEMYASTDSSSPSMQIREVSAQTTGGPGSQSSLTQHFGLGAATIIDSLRVLWPSNHIQVFYDINANTYYSLEEDSDLRVKEIGAAYSDCKTEVSQNCEIGIFPNPGLGIVNIDGSQDNKIDWVSVYDIYGRLVYSGKAEGDLDLSYLDIRNSTAKIHFIYLETTCGPILKKYIKQ